MGDTKVMYRKFLQAHDGSTGSHKYAILVDKKAEGTDAGAASATTWNARLVNTVIAQKGSMIAVNQNGTFTAQPGIYKVRISAPAYGAVGLTKLRLYNVTASAVIATVIGCHCSGVASSQVYVTAQGELTLTAETSLRIDQYTTSAVATNGLGIAMDLTGYDEYYTEICLESQTDPDVEDSI